MIFRKSSGAGGGNEDATRKYSPAGKPPASAENEMTAFVARAVRQPDQPQGAAHDEPQTRLHVPQVPQGERSRPWDPVVGWLVIIDGPGRGNFFGLGFGMNQIGRDAAQKVSLNFGDDRVSRIAHASLTFDPVSRRFFLAHGGGRNLTYVGGAAVLSPTELVGGETIVVGQTQMCFVPFCGPNFAWQTG